jgi:hypothetical protein
MRAASFAEVALKVFLFNDNGHGAMSGVSPLCAQKRTLLLDEMIDRVPTCSALAIILPRVTLCLPRCAAHTQALAFPIATEVDDRVLQKRPSLLGRRPSFFGRNVPGKDGFGPCWEFLYASETLHRPYTCSAPPRLAVLQGGPRVGIFHLHTRLKEAAIRGGLFLAKKSARYCGTPSTTKVRNFATFSRVGRRSLNAAETRYASNFSRLSHC